MTNQLNALTVDVEDYYQVTAFEGGIERNHWDDFESRVVASTHRLLELLDARDVQATFFVLGWVASRFPQLVRDIHLAGHEVGSHSFSHQLVYRLSPTEFREDLRRSRDALEDAIGAPVTSYRAPSFSITKDSWWALETLAEEGFRVDSSVFPVYHHRYGIPDAQPHLHQVQTPSGELWEFPLSVARLLGCTFPIAGGGYFRLYPFRWSSHFLSRINTVHGQPFIFYIHPWELDPAQPRLKHGTSICRFRHYLNLESTERKLDRLLQTFRFGTVAQVIQQANRAMVEPVTVS